MGLLEKSLQRAKAAAEDAQRLAVEEGWDPDRVEQEKQRLALTHDVSFCDTVGCLGLVTEAAGYRGLRCAQCRMRDGDG